MASSGLTNKAEDRARWAGDREMQWVIYLGIYLRTARRFVHATGLYEPLRAEAESLGLLEAATPESLGAKTSMSPELLKALHERVNGPVDPPRSYATRWYEPADHSGPLPGAA